MKLSKVFLSVFCLFGLFDSVLSWTIEDVEGICERCPTGFYKIPGLDKCYGLIDEAMPKFSQAIANCSEK